LHVAKTEIHAAHDYQHLYVAFRAHTASERAGEWVAVELANMAANERWRFVVTARGNGAIERHTREGQFRIEGAAWQFARTEDRTGYNVEMKIPLELIGVATNTKGQKPIQLRLNFLRRINDTARNARYIVRAYPDAGDTKRMAVMTLR
ncbi:MAG TPA: hypothetical protein VF719_06980, partial [Abditibacteriaceae bacterium]